MDSGILRRPVARTAIALVVLAAVVVAALSIGSTRARAQAINVTGSQYAQPLPAGFVGLSIELKALEQYAGSDPSHIDPVLVHLIQDTAPDQSPVLRIGGDSTDWSWWPVARTARPGGVRFTLTPQWTAVAHALASMLRARLILGIDAEADSAAVATTEADQLVQRIGRQYIDALELGNEPELYGSFPWYKSAAGVHVRGRPRGYNIADYTRDFTGLSSGLPSVPLAGPSSGGPQFLAGLSAFLRQEPRVKLVTVHAYPLKHCTKSTVVTIGQLLADSSSHGLAAHVQPLLNAARRHHAGLRIDEMNGISCGGTRGVSDTFSSALWLLDTLFEMERIGVNGVNIHSVPNTINEILGPQFARGQWAIRVHPEFYGMVMFAQAAPAGSRLLRLSSPVPSGVKIWATRAPNGAIHVVAINKSLAKAQTVHLRIAGASGTAAVEELRAPSAHSTSGVTLGGQTFGAVTDTGVLAGPTPHQTADPSNGVYTVRVPPATATMLSLNLG